MKSLLSTAAVLSLASAAFAEMPQIAPIPSVTPVSAPSAQIRICTGEEGGAYYATASQMLGLVQSEAKMPVTVEPGGGTIGCLRKLAAGTAEVAVVQLDGMAWAQTSAPDLFGRLGAASRVLTEDMAAVCRRDADVEDLNDVAQESGGTIAIAGGAESGSLLTLNVLASFDDDFAQPTYRLSGSWQQALNDVRSGLATCAFGVISFDAPLWRDLNDAFGADLRLAGFWDGDMRDLKLSGRQVYGWRAIPEESQSLDELLDWNGRGRLWSPEVGTVPALVVYRTDMLPNGSAILTDASATVAKIKETQE